MTQFFCIAFIGRVGSSYLQGLIDDHPQAECKGEIFAGYGPFEKEGPARFLAKFGPQSTHPVEGFKIGLIHLRFAGVEDFLAGQGYDFVHLVRENRLDQYISVKLAGINKSFRSDFGAYKQHSFRCEDFGQVERLFGVWDKEDADIAEVVGRMPGRVMTYSYERLLAEGPGPVFDFLGLERRDVESQFKRQRETGSQRAAIENYDELAAYFRDKPGKEYFTELNAGSQAA